MNEIQKQALVILGAPCSGLGLLMNCLGLLGLVDNFTNREDTDINSPTSINRLLLQDLQCAPKGVGGLPDGWQQTGAAAKARARIRVLLTKSTEPPLPCLIIDSVLCQVLPLWLEVFHELNIEPRFIHIVRHPWEVANALMQTEGIELFKGHLLWLANHREAFSGSSGYSRTIITFDQLLADPISTLLTIGKVLDIEYPLGVHSAYRSLIDRVQPGLKNHHAGHASEEGRERFALFNRIYDGLRVIQSHPDFCPDYNWPVCTPMDISPNTAWASLGLPSSTNASESTSSTELVDLLFKVIGTQERQARTLDSQKASLTNGSPVGQPLMAKFYFPHVDGTFLSESAPLLADEWQQITLPVPRPDLLHSQSLRFSPLNSHGTVLISALKLINRATGEVLWTAQTPQDFDALTFDGTALRLPDLNNLVLLVTGDKALIYLPDVGKLPDYPVEFEIWMKVSREQVLISNLWESMNNELLSLKREMNHVVKEIKNLKNTLHKERSERILSFAYRDSGGEIPRNYIILLTLHRCGSTWLMDAIRTHPDIYIEPRAYINELLNLKSYRYPGDLSDGPDAVLDIEIAAGVGKRIPALGAKQKPGLLKNNISEHAYAIEKIHPEFFFFNTEKFLADIEKLENEKNICFKFIYQIRDPKSLISSFIKYKRRKPAWYSHMDEGDLPKFIFDELIILLDFYNHRDGLVIDYSGIKNYFDDSLSRIFKFIWPNACHENLKQIVLDARAFTDRDRRLKVMKTPFLGETVGTVQGGDSDLKDYFELHQTQVDDCYEIYSSLKEKAFL